MANDITWEEYKILNPIEEYKQHETFFQYEARVNKRRDELYMEWLEMIKNNENTATNDK